MDVSKSLLEQAGIHDEHDAKREGIPPATYYRAKNGKVNKWLHDTLKMRAGTHDDWPGLIFRNGTIKNIHGETLNANTLNQWQYALHLAYERGREEERQLQRCLVWGLAAELPKVIN